MALTGYRRDAVIGATGQLRRRGWLHLERRGFRGRTSLYRADSPGLVLRSEVVTGAEYVGWDRPTSPEYVGSDRPTSPEYVGWDRPTSPEYVGSDRPSTPTRSV